MAANTARSLPHRAGGLTIRRTLESRLYAIGSTARQPSAGGLPSRRRIPSCPTRRRLSSPPPLRPGAHREQIGNLPHKGFVPMPRPPKRLGTRDPGEGNQLLYLQYNYGFLPGFRRVSSTSRPSAPIGTLDQERIGSEARRQYAF